MSGTVQGGLVRAGASFDEARGALVLMHGRGGTPEGMIPVARASGALADFAVLAPRAPAGSWYPLRFRDPKADNEPALTAALDAIDGAVREALDGGVAGRAILLVGFSQGACLSLEYLKRQAMQGGTGTPDIGGVLAMAGALMGPIGEMRVDPGTREDSLVGTPVILACGDADEHIPVEHVGATADTFRALGAEVDLRVYPGVGHSIVGDQLDALRALVAAVRAR